MEKVIPQGGHNGVCSRPPAVEVPFVGQKFPVPVPRVLSIKGDEDEDVKQNDQQDLKTSLLKRDRRVAFAADTDFNASHPNEEDAVDNNTVGKYVRGPSRAQQKRRKASIQKWNKAYSSSDTTKKSFKS